VTIALSPVDWHGYPQAVVEIRSAGSENKVVVDSLNPVVDVVRERLLRSSCGVSMFMPLFDRKNTNCPADTMLLLAMQPSSVVTTVMDEFTPGDAPTA